MIYLWCYLLKLKVEIIKNFWWGVFLSFFRRRSQESSESHTHRNCGVPACLLPGLFWGFSCTDTYDAILSTRWEKSSASSIWICWMGSCKIRCSCGIPLCIVHKVKALKYKFYWEKLIDNIWHLMFMRSFWRLSSCKGLGISITSTFWTWAGLDHSRCINLRSFF